MDTRKKAVHITSDDEEKRVMEIMKDGWSSKPMNKEYYRRHGSDIGICIYNHEFSWCSLSYFLEHSKDYNLITFQQFLDKFTPKPQLTKDQLRNKLFLKWVELNNIKVGSKVRVLSNTEIAYAAGICVANSSAGEVFTVYEIPDTPTNGALGIEKNEREAPWYWPYENLDLVTDDSTSEIKQLIKEFEERLAKLKATL